MARDSTYTSYQDSLEGRLKGCIRRNEKGISVIRVDGRPGGGSNPSMTITWVDEFPVTNTKTLADTPEESGAQYQQTMTWAGGVLTNCSSWSKV